MTSNYALVRQAVIRKQQVIATYDNYPREMCPHVLGTKNGRPQALFYQFAGQSKSGLQPDGSPANWRCVPIEKLTNVSIRDGKWHTAANHSRKQTCVDIIDVEVEF
jgi:hypothetical protein